MGRHDLTAGSDGLRITAERCADAARREAVDPIGTSGCYDGFVLVEWPLPWPRDAAEVPALAPLVAELDRQAGDGRRWRLQLIAGADLPGPGGLHTLVVACRRDDGAVGFRSRTLKVPMDQLVATACRSVREGDVVDGSSAAGSAGEDDAQQPVDVLICTHGARDACCGSRGTALFQVTKRATFDRPCRIWRTSHLGGHRFAPAALVLPDGTSWAYLDEERLADVIDRRVPPHELRSAYRGNASIAAPVAQVAEREALVAEGWGWLGCRAAITVDPAGSADDVDAAGPRARSIVDVSFHRSDGTDGRIVLEVGEAEPCALPPCRGQGKGTIDTTYVVTRVTTDRR